jgi:hypothetical protein
MLPLLYTKCSTHLCLGPALNVAEFVAWFGAHNDGEWVKENDEDGYTLLHIGMKNKAPAEVIKLLVEACPEAVKGEDVIGKTPLHYGMGYKKPTEVIKLLVDACPEAVAVKDREGNTPLHLGMIYNAPAEAIKLLVDVWPDSVKEKDEHGNTALHYGMKHNAPAEVIKLLVEACPEAVNEYDVWGFTPLHLGMKHNASPIVLEMLRHPSQLWIPSLKEGSRINVPAFAAWFGQRRWVAKSKYQQGTTPLQLATKHNAPAAVLELLRAAQSIPLTTQTLAGDTLSLRGWEDAWAAPGANVADALVAENPTALQGAYGDEMEPVRLNPTTMELSPVLFRPLVAVEVEVVGVETPTTLCVRLALEGGTVGYARRKIGVLVGMGDGGDMHAGRLWLVGGASGGTGKRTRRQPEDGELLQTVCVTGGGGGGGGGSGGRASLLYERHRTWKGAFTFAPKYEPVPVPDLSCGWVQVEEGVGGGAGGAAAAAMGAGGRDTVAAGYSAPTRQRSVEEESAV